MNSILKILGVHKGEESRVLLLLGVGFFMGIFLASYEVSAISKYIENVRFEKLPQGIAYSGLAGIVATFLFSRAEASLKFSALAIISFIIIAFTVATFAAGFLVLKNFPAYMPMKIDEDGLSKAAFIIMGPMNAITLLVFWGIFGRLFNVRQSKRLAGSIDTGQVMASIIAFVSIALAGILIKNKAGEDIDLLNYTHILLIISTGCVIASLLFVSYLVRTNKLIEPTHNIEEGKKAWGAGLIKLFSNKYVLLIAAFVAISAVAATFIEFGYFKSIQLQSSDLLGERKLEITTFVSFFEATVLILGFLIQTFLNDKLMEMYGLKVSLLILPVIIVFFGAISVVVGFLGEDGSGLVAVIGELSSIKEETGEAIDIKEFEQSTGSNITNLLSKYGFFFVILAAINLFTQSLRDALESPAVKMFYMPLDSSERLSAQTNIEGIVGQFATFIGGMALLLLIGLDLEQTHLQLLLLGLIVLWVFVTVAMHNQYKGTLQSTLSQHAKEDDALAFKEENIYDLLEKDLKQGLTAKVIYHLRLLEKMDPAKYEDALIEILSNHKSEIRSYGLNKIGSMKLFSARWDIRKLIDKEKDSEVKALAEKTFKILNELDLENTSTKQLLELVKSRNPKDRVMVARAMETDVPVEMMPQFIMLLRDNNEEVRKAAIIAASKNKRTEFWPLIVESLAVQSYATAASSAIMEIGEEILDQLDVSFYRSDQTQQTMLRIIQIVGHIGGKRAMSILWNKVDYPDRKVSGQAMMALGKLGFQPDEFQIIKIRNAIELDIQDIAWNMSAISEIEGDDTGILVIRAIQEENVRHFEHLYLLLSMIYDAQSIQLVKDNIEKGTPESVGYALELLDIFVDDNLKPQLRALFDDVDEIEKSKRLQTFYPRTELDGLEVLKAVINKDYNHSSRWAKACALYKIAVSDNKEVYDDIVANMFNPSSLLRELAAWCVYKKDKRKYEKVALRLQTEVQKELARLLKTSDDELVDKMLFGVALYLKKNKTFKGISSELVLEIVDHLHEVYLKPGERIYVQSKDGDMPVIIVREGRLGVKEQDTLISEIPENTVVGEVLSLDTDLTDTSLEATQDTVCYVINKDRFFEMIANDQKIAQNIIHVISGEVLAEEGDVIN